MDRANYSQIFNITKIWLCKKEFKTVNENLLVLNLLLIKV